MQIKKMQNNNILSQSLSFGEGRVYLKRITKKEILTYEAMRKTAENNKLDLRITKINNSKYLPTCDCYIVSTTKDTNKHPFSAQKTTSIFLNKHTKPIELSAKLYDTVIKTIEKLG